MIFIREMMLKVGTSYLQGNVCKIIKLRNLLRLIDIEFINKNLAGESILSYLRLRNIATDS